MILGLLSDTHGQRRRAAQAARRLRAAGAEALVHCGDVGGDGVLEELAGWRAWVVLGNTDAPSRSRGRRAPAPGLIVSDQGPLRIELDGQVLLAFHGHEAAFEYLLQAAHHTGEVPPAFGRCDYVLHGHTHVARDVRIGPLRVINPGALYRTATPTVATLDPATGQLRVLPIELESLR